MKVLNVVALLATSVAGAGAASTQPAVQAAQPADFSTRADAILAAAYPADGPGAAAIVTRGGRVVYAGGRGLADVEGQRPITADTVFRLGSITKQFTAAVILQLVAEGRISLDDPLTRFLPDYPQPGGAATIRQLLNHTSGIQSYTGIPGWMAGDNPARAHTTAEMVGIFRDLPAPSRPGEAWAYNNSGYVLLGAVIEAVTGRPWHQAVDERIARPLGLSTIRYGVDGESAPAMARGYTASENGQAPARPIHMSVPHAAGALVGTVGDLARWAQALHGGRVVSRALYREMTSPTRLRGGGTQPYGFGLGFTDIRGHATIGHGGGIFGFNTDSAYIPSADLFVAVFANSDDPAAPPGAVARRLAALALGNPYPEFVAAAADVAALGPSFGVYRIGEEGLNRRFFARDGKLYTQRDGNSEREVFATADGRFFYGPNDFTWFHIVRQADGGHVMEMHQQGEDEAERSVRTGPVPPEPPAFAVDPAVLRSYVGSYQTPGPVATIAMTEGGTLTVQLGQQPAFAMRATSANEFSVDRVNARIVFNSEDGSVTGLTIHQGGRTLEARRSGN